MTVNFWVVEIPVEDGGCVCGGTTTNMFSPFLVIPLFHLKGEAGFIEVIFSTAVAI